MQHQSSTKMTFDIEFFIQSIEYNMRRKYRNIYVNWERQYRACIKSTGGHFNICCEIRVTGIYLLSLLICCVQ